MGRTRRAVITNHETGKFQPILDGIGHVATDLCPLANHLPKVIEFESRHRFECLDITNPHLEPAIYTQWTPSGTPIELGRIVSNGKIEGQWNRLTAGRCRQQCQQCR